MTLTRTFPVTVYEISDFLDSRKANGLLIFNSAQMNMIALELRLDTPQVTSILWKLSAKDSSTIPKENNEINGKVETSKPTVYSLGDRFLLLIRHANKNKNCQAVYRLQFVSKEERDSCHNLLCGENAWFTVQYNGNGPLKNGFSKASHDDKHLSVFDERTDSTSAKQYFQFYALLSQQQNMLQDFVRTSTYQRAMHLNCADFRDKVVLDVGTGTGILSYFAIQAGARKVYAVEASNMADYCEKMVNANNMAGRIIVVNGKVEEISLPEPVDVIISEPMGYMLFNERMLESYIHARKFLRNPQHHPKATKSISDNTSDDMLDSEKEMMDASDTSPAKMYPSVANLYVAPFTDEALFLEVQGKANFWFQQSFHGVNLSSLQVDAMKEYVAQPIVDTFDMSICMAKAQSYHVDFRTCEERDLYDIRVPLQFTITYSGLVHGLAFWFDVAFLGTQQIVWLSTSPNDALTHWYQVRCLFPTPLFAQEGVELEGVCHMKCNDRQSYDVYIELSIPGTRTKISNTLDLKNPCFRYTGYPSQPPGQTQSKPPTELYYERMASQNPSVMSMEHMSHNQQIQNLSQQQSQQHQPLRTSLNFTGGDLNTNVSSTMHQFGSVASSLQSSSCFGNRNGAAGHMPPLTIQNNVLLTSPTAAMNGLSSTIDIGRGQEQRVSSLSPSPFFRC